jgi:hypothetical protein
MNLKKTIPFSKIVWTTLLIAIFSLEIIINAVLCLYYIEVYFTFWLDRMKREFLRKFLLNKK